MSKTKGAARERELVHAFRDVGGYAQRVATSGSGTEAELPDVLGAVDGERYVMELKYADNDRLYVDEEKVVGLLWLAEQVGAYPRLVGRWKRDTTFYSIHPKFATRTDGGNYRLHRDDRDWLSTLPPHRP